MKTIITIKDWDYQKHDNKLRQIIGNIFTIPDYEEIKLISEKQYSGWMIFEVTTGLAVCPFSIHKTKKAAIEASLRNFTKYGKEKILKLIESSEKIN